MVDVAGITFAVWNKGGEAYFSIILSAFLIDYSGNIFRIVIELDGVGFSLVLWVFDDEFASDWF